MKLHKPKIYWALAFVANSWFLAVSMTLITPSQTVGAPFEGTQSMAELTADDRKPLQLSDRSDIKHEGREAFIKGYQAQKSGYWAIAIKNYQQATEINPDMYEAFWNLGLCLEIDNKMDKAKEAFNTALKLDWSNPLVYKHLAYISFQRGDGDEGREWLKKYLHR